MIKNFTRLFLFLFISLASQTAIAQCGAGYTNAELNWDHLDFLPSNNTRYTSFYPSVTFPYTQNFTMGTRSINFAITNNITLSGENATNTAHSGSLATAGDDVQFNTTSTVLSLVNMTFDVEVTNLRFSLFDIDNNQRVSIVASNTLGVPQNISIVRANGGSGIGITGSGGSSPVATAPNGNYNNNDNNGTINVTIPGNVKRVTISLSTAIGDLWLSDLDACVSGAFPNNYQQISRPFTGQPQYVLTVVNNRIYYTDPATGNAYYLFTEPGHNRLNSMAYDPYKRQVYYTYSLTGGNNPRNDKALKRYNVDTKTISVVIPNVNAFGIPTYESGVESGAATFYNGSLYLGIEGYTGTDNDNDPYAAGRKSTIWKIDFDILGIPIAPASQVFGVTADDGTNPQNIHDWSDFGITNGVLVDFDGSQSGDIDYYHFNLMTGVRTEYNPIGNIVPRQVSIGWDEVLYNVDATIQRYNGTDGVVAGTARVITAPFGPTIPTGGAASWGDAAGPYRPFLDFGDAPTSYDPNPLSPACHDTLNPPGTELKLGIGEDVEWNKIGFTSIEDLLEDALSFVPIFSSTLGTYVASAVVKNTTGKAATLCAWLDANGNGVFDVSEAVNPITIPSMPGFQTFNLAWTGLPTTLPNGIFTFLRVRVTNDKPMTKSDATGYYANGEVEDYQIIVENNILPMSMLDFTAMLGVDGKSVDLNWTGSEDLNFLGYRIERRTNDKGWETMDFISGKGESTASYKWIDQNPESGILYYRIAMLSKAGSTNYSQERRISINGISKGFFIGPNPATDRLQLSFDAAVNALTEICIYNMQGSRLYHVKIKSAKGANSIPVHIPQSWQNGIYVVKLWQGDKVMGLEKIVVRR